MRHVTHNGESAFRVLPRYETLQFRMHISNYLHSEFRGEIRAAAATFVHK